MSRPVHYVPSGCAPRALDCPAAGQECEWWLKAGEDGEPRCARPVRSTTDVRRVTCAECWRILHRLAERARGRGCL